MAALKRAGFANIATSQRPDDGLKLTDAYIAAAVRCAPPANKPLPEEINRCLVHLQNEIVHLPRVRVVEIAPVAMLLALCFALTVAAGPAMRYLGAAAQALHAP